MSQINLKIEECDQSSLTSILKLFQMRRKQLSQENVSRNIAFISFSAVDHSECNFGGISGWKSFDYSYIESLWVDPSMKKKGIGTQLVKKFIEKSKSLGCSTVTVSTTNFSGSEPFWKKNSFVEFAEFKTAEVEVKYLKLII
jgi:GNAT superfamily N-acetyltransferase